MSKNIKIAKLSTNGVTQPWKNARPRQHLAVMSRSGKETYRALRAAGFEPFLVAWIEFSVGLPEHLRMDEPGWETMVEFHRALKGIYLRRDKVTCCMDVGTGWVWDVGVQGAGLSKAGNPLAREAWLRRQQPNLPVGK
jgi:hypothetical protein